MSSSKDYHVVTDYLSCECLTNIAIIGNPSNVLALLGLCIPRADAIRKLKTILVPVGMETRISRTTNGKCKNVRFFSCQPPMTGGAPLGVNTNKERDLQASDLSTL